MACLLPGLNKLIKCKSFVNIILSFSLYDLDLKYSSIFGGAVDFSAYTYFSITTVSAKVRVPHNFYCLA